DTLDEVPEPQRIDFLLPSDLQRSALQNRAQCEIGPKADVLAERRDHLLDGGDQLISVAEMIEHDDPPTWTAYPDHLGDHFSVVRHRCDHIRGHNSVEAVVGKLHLARIHAELDNVLQTLS